MDKRYGFIFDLENTNYFQKVLKVFYINVFLAFMSHFQIPLYIFYVVQDKFPM